jgi:tetratricopeptide (TPR) repeat protein
MSSWKCLSRADIPRGRTVLALSLTLLTAALAANRGNGAILPPDAAARAFEAGRDAVKRKDYAIAVKRLEEALATGHTKPEERLGTTRNFVDRYDPDYWLGVAYMETGDKEKARLHLVRSKSNGAIARWPEYSDLVTRLSALQEEPKPPEPTAVPPEPQKTPPLPTPPPTPTAKPLPIPPKQPTPVPMLASAPSTPAPAGRPRLDATELASLLTLLSHAEWRAFESDLARARARVPEALEPSLLEAVACGSRYLLEGKKDGALLERAKRSLADYRRRGGPRRAERLFISPALEAVL